MTFFLYILWFLPVVVLLILGIESSYRKLRKHAEQQSPAFYFNQAMFCLLAFICSVLLDIYAVPHLKDTQLVQTISEEMTRFMVYPFCLMVLSSINGWFRRYLEDRYWKE
ncbi:hypothetical protein JNK13_06285 [bacterium]|nr:hypothetical protein [bacterium]